MSTALTLPIARLRAAGCRVSTVLGHDRVGAFIYGVTLPDGIPFPTERRIGLAVTENPRDGYWIRRRIIVRSVGRHLGAQSKPVPKDITNRIGLDAAAALTYIADFVDLYDQESSASRQHRIDTGEFALRADLVVDQSTGYTQDDVIGVRFVRTTHEDVVRVVDILVDADGRPFEGGSSEYDLDECRLRDLVDYHTKQIEG